jgi:hypothetical protein
VKPYRIIQGDVLAGLATLPDASVHCCVTSPPYWGLRDYGVDGQIGLESTPAEYVAKMVAVFREVRRVLKDDGTPLSPQYLCDVEADRRIIANPLLVRELAAELGVPAEVLWYGTLPEVLRSDRDVPPQRIVNAFAAFRRSLGGRSHE